MPKIKGHWPKGKRRNPDTGDWSATRLRIVGLLQDHFRPTVISASVLAELCGVESRTVRRWLSGEDRPNEDRQQILKTWSIETAKSVASQTTKIARG